MSGEIFLLNLVREREFASHPTTRGIAHSIDWVAQPAWLVRGATGCFIIRVQLELDR